MNGHEQKIIDVTCFAGSCSCDWKGNPSPTREDAELHAAEHAAWHDEQDRLAAEAAAPPEPGEE